MKTIAQQLKITEFPFKIKDSKGNKIYYEDSDGFWSKREYNSNGKTIYYEDSSGFWSKREYDSNSNEIYWENSNGYWGKYQYDSNGNQIYYEDSSGDIEDNRTTPEFTMEELVNKLGNFKIKK